MRKIGIAAAIAAGAVVLTLSPLPAVAQGAPSAHPKRILLVTTTVGFRHASVPLLERVIRQMAQETGEFTIVSTTDSPDYPEADYFRTVAQRNAAHGATPNDLPPINNNFFGPIATPAQYAALDKVNEAIAGAEKAAAEAAQKLTRAMDDVPADSGAVDAALREQAAAEAQLARARWQAVHQMQASPARLDRGQIAALVKVASQAPGGELDDFESGGVTMIPVLAGAGGGGLGAGAPPAAGAPLTTAQQSAVAAMMASLQPPQQAMAAARAALADAEFDPATTEAGLQSKIAAVQAAGRTLARAHAAALAEIESSPARLSAAQAQEAVSRPRRGGFGRGGPGRGANPTDSAVAKVLQQYLNPNALRNYDAVIFASTTGELPIPDKAAFFQWIREGHGFIGIHSATDTLHHTPAYIQMIGGEFADHGMFHPAMPVQNVDPGSPITAGWGSSRTITEEFYLFKNFDPAKVHLLLAMRNQPYSKQPGLYPVSWIKMYGKGRVFYTSLGHRDDVILPHAVIGDEEFKVRYNQAPVAEAFQQELLQGIRWATGLIQADATPGNVR
ncbi:MAG TPA: ThuA domain-containing protein [Terriglobales bacterium]|nr:ThuA domain-containing protein [Terriglobales bacterium]